MVILVFNNILSIKTLPGAAIFINNGNPIVSFQLDSGCETAHAIALQLVEPGKSRLRLPAG
jgi:hypothetical protein